LNPVVAVQYYLISVKFSMESSTHLRIRVAVEAKDREIALDTVAWILVDMMDLDRLAGCPTDTAGPIRLEQNTCSKINRDRVLLFALSHLH
jgi:hypothetical protein